jgi:dTDP-4-dehydrorhamnose reductase
VVDDQLGQPTWTFDVADLVHRLVVARVPAGTYHGTASGSTSWHGFAQAVVGAAGLDPQIVRPTSSAAFVRPAPRPAYSVLGHGSLTEAGVTPIGPWESRWAVAAESVLAS